MNETWTVGMDGFTIIVKGEAGRGWSSLSSLGVALKGASSEESNKQLKLCY
ncbi:hypothetical protein NEUTE1DRAFT_117453 [Neurospora tetrasperma FGSC 2508]|uniref:Uncharacterized protein n=1 Tax=Neurospora tetrasperma (strain FGSC 2508 / ATCC MYA-4615 / P0657) TaxID=510951 RepID=F8MQT4_NEUT8|nr:uncharacterized protein NEUTE1DRAFT_117453 [Neurospora tetrasperma FGSC 2508]EGO56714.1 hypothetical protein NEUTE1DRAFT_117453 [Neurospora tetrasperma FGSC 2508]